MFDLEYCDQIYLGGYCVEIYPSHVKVVGYV